MGRSELLYELKPMSDVLQGYFFTTIIYVSPPFRTRKRPMVSTDSMNQFWNVAGNPYVSSDYIG